MGLWGFAALLVLLLTLAAARVLPQLTHVTGKATSVTIPCGDLPSGPTLWKADANSSLQVILPDTISCAAGVTVPSGSQLVIDGSNGPVQVFSHGVGIDVDGGSMSTLNTSAANSVTFDAEPDVPSWNGLTFSADLGGNKGNGWLEYVSIQHAVTAITVNSGATSTQRMVGGVAVVQPYGLYINNSGIGPSYFDGINIQDTPVSVTGMSDGRLGTINNIGSRGIEANFSRDAPTPTADSLHIEGIVFGSSAPFGAQASPPSVVCDPTKPICGTIGNEAIFGSFSRGHNQPVSITGNQILRTGAYGIQLLGVDNLTLQNNVLDCSGTGSATPIADQCQGTGLKYPALYLNDVTWSFDGGTSGNTGFQNGFDAIAFNGKAGADVTWQTPTINTAQTGALGYFINGSLNANGHTLTVKDNDVVKVKDGGITLAGGILDASSAGQKTFTSVRDNSVGLKLCPSVFAQSCPTTLPPHEWAGIAVDGANGTGTATIVNSTIAYPSKAINATSGATSLVGGYALVVTDSRIGPTFSDGVSALGTPILLSGDTFVCPIDTVPTDPNFGRCASPSVGDHGVTADFTNAPAHLGGGLTVGSSIHGPTTFQGSVNEAILGTGLGGQTVSITGTVVKNAGSYGIQLQGADNLTLTGNDISSSGTASPRHSAIYLNGVLGDFGNGTTTGKIRGNTGTGNGLNAVVLHGKATTPTIWQTVGKNGLALGYLLDGSLEVDGNLTLNGDVAEALSGGITVKGGVLSSTDSTFTSLRDNVNGIPTCGTVFVPLLPQPSTACLAAAPGDWNGLTLDIAGLNSLTAAAGTSEVRFAAVGISVGDPANAGTAQVLSMTGTNVRSVTGDGVNAQSAAISVSGGTFSNIGQHGVKADFSDAVPGQALTVDGVTFSTVGREAIFADSLSKQTVAVKNNHIGGAGTSGIYLQAAADPTVSQNTVVNSGNPPALNPAASFPAIFLDGVKGDFTTKIFGNTGAHNGVNALAFHGEATGALTTWQSARPSSNVNTPPALGYVLDDSLLVDGQLKLAAGDIVKVGKGFIKLTAAATPNDATLSADSTGSSSQKIFTSLADNAAGVIACPSSLLPTCSPGSEPVAGAWSGLILTGDASGAFVNTSIRNASTGITIDSKAVSTAGSSVFGLTVSHSSIGPSSGDGINAKDTPVSVTDSTIWNKPGQGLHGLRVNLASSVALDAAIRVSGVQFKETGSDAILAEVLGGHPVWIADNHIANAHGFGIHLQNADSLVLRNNNISGSGGNQFSAIYLDGVKADFVRNVRGNVGTANYVNALVFHGTVTSDLTWVTPGLSPTHALGYMLDGSVTMDGPRTLKVKANDVVKSLGGPITLNGGTLKADDAGAKLFTSLKDMSGAGSATAGSVFSCPSVFTPSCTGSRGDWGGIVLSDDGAGNLGNGSLRDAALDFSVTAITIDSGDAASGPSTGPLLTLTGTAIAEASVDGVNASDTPMFIVSDGASDSSIAGTGSHGIVASYFSSVACPASGDCLKIDHVHVTNTRKDAILASGLAGLATDITNNCIGATAVDPCVAAASASAGAGTYGIRLVGADMLTLKGNSVFNTGNGATVHYPGIYLNGVSGDFGDGLTSHISGNSGAVNGLNAIAFHGTATTDTTWLTVAPAGALGYLLDGTLTNNGKFSAPGGVVEALNGSIVVNGALAAPGATFTSMKDTVSGVTGCPSVFVSGGCAPATGDWHGLTVSGAINLAGATITFVGSDAITATGNNVTVDCASIHGNSGGGVTFTGTNDSVNNSDVFGNAGVGVTGVATTTADHDWWGTATATLGTDYAGFGAPTHQLPQQKPTTTAGGGTITVAGTNQNADPSNTLVTIGKGTATFTIRFDRKMDKSVMPTVGFGLSGGASRDVTAATPLNNGWIDDYTWVGTATIAPGVGPNTADAGQNTLTVSDAKSCQPDYTVQNVLQTANVMAPETSDFIVDYTPPSTPSASASNVGQTATLGITLDPHGWTTTGSFSVSAVSNSYTGALPDATVAGIGNGTSPESLTVLYPPLGSGVSLTAGTTYYFEAVVDNGNGTATSLEHSFTTTDSASHFLVEPNPMSMTAGDTTTVTVTALDPSNATVGDYPGTVNITSTDTQAGKPPDATLTNGSGTFPVTLKTTPSQTITATDKDHSGITGVSASVTVTAAAPSQLGFSSAAKSTTAGQASTAITVQVQDAFGNEQNSGGGVTVKLSSTNSGGTFLAADGTTALATAKTVTISGGASTAQFTYKDTLASTPTLTAHDDAATLTDGTQQETVVAAGMSAANSTVSAFPTNHILADNSQSATITVTLKDGFGNLIAGKAVAISPNTGTSSTIATVSGTTNSKGRATFRVKDGTAETVTYTASDTDDTIDVTATVAVTFDSSTTVSPTNSTIVLSTSSVTANGSDTATITVTLKDGGGAKITGKAVSLAQNGVSVIAASGATTDLNGQVIFTVEDATVENVTYAVIADSIAVMQTSIDFHN